MSRFRTTVVRNAAIRTLAADPAPRANGCCRRRASVVIGFALTLLLASGALPVAVAPSSLLTVILPVRLVAGPVMPEVGEALRAWRRGDLDWEDLRELAAGDRRLRRALEAPPPPAPARLPGDGTWGQGLLRVVHLGPGRDLRRMAAAPAAGDRAGTVRLLHDLDLNGGVQVVAVDPAGLRRLLDAGLAGRLLLDRCGRPALDVSRGMVGAERAARAPWLLGRDWSATVAILDSGCDTAHGDLGDPPDDDIDGPPPAVGDAADWYPADLGWSLSQGFKVVGWHDVTDDFPDAAGPWDYHYHGTGLASATAGSGAVDPDYRGVAPGGRLTVVKFYDFDGQWRTWAGDFLAACAWTLEHADLYRVRTVLCAVNWDEDLGISAAMADFVAAGILPVAAMGNEGDAPGGPGYPARLPGVLTVGAVNDQGAVAAYSGRGGVTVAKPDLLAPGGGLLTTGGRITVADNEPDDSYSGRYGTSLAAAHAAGAVYTLHESLRDAGLILPGDPASARTLRGLLSLTCAAVDQAETTDGAGTVPLPPTAAADSVRGWGLLRIDAAVEALRRPLPAGGTVVDTLDDGHPVASCRLLTTPGTTYTLEATSALGLDAALAVADPLALGTGLEDDPFTVAIQRSDGQGAGGAETLTVVGPDSGWLACAVRRVQGQGPVTLRLTAEAPASFAGSSFILPGSLSGDPNLADLSGDGDYSLVLPSRVTVDLPARALNVTDMNGIPRPGWPVFIFPDPSSQGGLTRALAWDLDGVAGDEIVAASQFGAVYFFSGSGQWDEILLEVNLDLRPPVGLLAADGTPLVAVADQDGGLRLWSQGPVLRAVRDFGHTHPLDPAAGSILGQAGEVLLIAFQDGFLALVDENLEDLPGWPRFLAHTLTLPPVMVDRDGDGFHEIVVPVWAGPGDDLRLRILAGDGSPAPADSTVLSPPAGGAWLALSPPAVTGSYASGGAVVSLVGLMDNGLSGDQARWSVGEAGLEAQGQLRSAAWPGFSVRAIALQSRLTLDGALLPAPLSAPDPRTARNAALAVVHIRWQDLLYGFASMPGAMCGWLRDGPASAPLALRDPLDLGGAGLDPVTGLGGVLVPRDDGYLRVDVRDDRVRVTPVPGAAPYFPAWLSARADGRNSGAAALPAGPASAAPEDIARGGLRVWPNPASGPVRFAVPRESGGDAARLEIFDLRGRRLVRRTLAADGGTWIWNGRTRDGRTLPAGVYLAVVREGGRRFSTRITWSR